MVSRSYHELIQLSTFEERYEYLRLDGRVGEETFGFDRWINQQFYRSREWQQVRNEVILRDNACDLGIPDHPIHGRLLVHHMNPVSATDIKEIAETLLNPEYLITTMKRTHDAIHYGGASFLRDNTPAIRIANDTVPWR